MCPDSMASAMVAEKVGPVHPMVWAALALLVLMIVQPQFPSASGEEGLDLFVVVDPGHGGDDTGASYWGVHEKDVVLEIALELRDLLEAAGADVLMTRETDVTVSLADRVALANDNNVDRFISVHANACGECGGHGTETYYHESLPPTSPAADLAGHAQDETVQLLGTNDRGVKTANFYVLRETTMPAVLVETAFLDHPGDHELLTDPQKQEDFARAILYGTQRHLGHEPWDPDEGTPPPPAITITEPDLDAWHRGTVTVEAQISAPAGLEWARAQVDNGAWKWDSVAPHAWQWDTASLPDGERDLHVQAKDELARYTSEHGVLKVDNTPPEVQITNPQDGDIVVLGTTVRADAFDATSGVAGVSFFVDGVHQATVTNPPYEWYWDTLWYFGWFDVTAEAVDQAGNTATHEVTVLVV